jgi:hypothetical protein
MRNRRYIKLFDVTRVNAYGCGGGGGLLGLLGLGKTKSVDVKTATAPIVNDTGTAALDAQEAQRKKLAQNKGYESTVSAGNSTQTGQVGTKSLLGS